MQGECDPLDGTAGTAEGGMIVRLIDADALKVSYIVPSTTTTTTTNSLCRLYVSIEDINSAPTIEAEPVRHGRIIKPKRWGEWSRCSLCDGTVPIVYNYCPRCGAKMDGGENA